MVRHVVMWKFKPGIAEAPRLQMKQRLEALAELVPSLDRIEVGLNWAEGEAAWDVVLVSEFASPEALAEYAIHPEHLKVVDLVRSLVCDRAVVDCTC